MPKATRSNLNFRQSPREFRSSIFARIAGHAQRLLPYTKYHSKRIWTIVAKPGRIALKYARKISSTNSSPKAT